MSTSRGGKAKEIESPRFAGQTSPLNGARATEPQRARSPRCIRLAPRDGPAGRSDGNRAACRAKPALHPVSDGETAPPGRSERHRVAERPKPALPSVSHSETGPPGRSQGHRVAERPKPALPPSRKVRRSHMEGARGPESQRARSPGYPPSRTARRSHLEGSRATEPQKDRRPRCPPARTARRSHLEGARATEMQRARSPRCLRLAQRDGSTAKERGPPSGREPEDRAAPSRTARRSHLEGARATEPQRARKPGCISSHRRWPLCLMLLTI